jgi:hypothetical protein
LCTFVIIFRLNFCKNKKCQKKKMFGEKIKTHFMFSNCTVEKNVEPDRPQMAKRCMRIACWITEATDTLRR